MKEYELCQLMEPEAQGGLQMDDEMAMDLLVRTHVILGTVLERKLPKRLHSDLAHLYKDIDDALSWHSIS